MRPFRTIQATLFVTLSVISVSSVASMCGVSWDGDKVAAFTHGKALGQQIRLNDSKGNELAQVTVAQIKAFHEAKDGIKQVTGRNPQFLICDDQSPNAFATKASDGGDLLGVTVGMMKMVNGDRDMAAAVIGHEYAHNIREHLSGSQTRNTVLNVLGAIAGLALDVAMEDKYGVSGFGQDIASLSTGLVARKFDRDQEREADQDGFNYMVRAGFNPTGAIRLSDKFRQLGETSGGWFFDSHPGWEERGETFKVMLSSNQEARRLASLPSSLNPSSNSNATSKSEPIQLALVPVFETSDAQKAYSEGLEALRKQDQVGAVKKMKSAALAGHASAQIYLGFGLEKGRNGLARDEIEAVRFYRLAAEQGNPIAQSLLGTMYERGRGGLAKDLNQALTYYRLSAKQGNAQGQAFLGTFYERGLGGIEKNDVEATRLYTLSAEKNNPIAQMLLGEKYEKGTGGLSKNHAEALRLYKLSADNGNPAGQLKLGLMYEIGLGGLPKDTFEAAKLYQLSANQGHPGGLASLGRMYDFGTGGFPKDEIEAVRLYRLAADEGNASGQVLLGTRYMKGAGGLPKDEFEGIRLYRLSAQQNSPLAKNNLGAAYEFGQGGLSKDIETAVVYYKEAAALGNSSAANNLKRLGR